MTEYSDPYENALAERMNRTIKEIIWTDLDGKASSWHNSDTFFVYQDHLIRRFPYYEQNDSVPKGNVWQSYILKNDQMVLENEKRVE